MLRRVGNPPAAPALLPPLSFPQHIRGPDGAEFRVTKGAPQVIAKLCGADAQPELKMRVEAEVANLGSRGIRSLAVARTLPGSLDQWEMLGMLTFLDPPRPDTKQTIEQVRAGEEADGEARWRHPRGAMPPPPLLLPASWPTWYLAYSSASLPS